MYPNEDEEDQYRSLNKETGLLEDIDEVREIVLLLAATIESLMKFLPVSLFMRQGMKLDLSSLIVSMEGLVQQTTQANYYRRLGQVLGVPRLAMEKSIREQGLSETYPLTHPLATKMNLPPLDPNDPAVRESLVLSEVARRMNKGAHSEKTPDPTPQELADWRAQGWIAPESGPPKPEDLTPLPPSLEAFLTSLGGELDDNKKDDPGGGGGPAD